MTGDAHSTIGVICRKRGILLLFLKYLSAHSDQFLVLRSVCLAEQRLVSTFLSSVGGGVEGAACQTSGD